LRLAEEVVRMGTVVVKSLDKADDSRTFSNGLAEMVTMGSTMVGRTTFQPGWRWSNDVMPIAGTDRCMILHKGYCISGGLVIQAEDGMETHIGPGDAYVVEPGHDAWVIGDETYVAIDFSEQMAEYAKPR
jgi:hypothetical protein